MAVTSGAQHLHDSIVNLFDAIRAKASVTGSMTFAEAKDAVTSIDPTPDPEKYVQKRTFHESVNVSGITITGTATGTLQA